jgi:hypothetical protein
VVLQSAAVEEARAWKRAAGAVADFGATVSQQ